MADSPVNLENGLAAQLAPLDISSHTMVDHDIRMTSQTRPINDKDHVLYEPGIIHLLPECDVTLDRFSYTDPKKELFILKEITASFRPGTMTLVMAPHGAGKSSLLKAIAGNLTAENCTGRLLYNGVTALDAGFCIQKMVALVEQEDKHWPLLTVRETLEFAQKCNAHIFDNTQSEEEHSRKVDAVISLLGLEDCAHTILGSPMDRGISGGQKKRVTLGEMLMGNPRVLCLDEISTGIDSSTTLEIFSALKTWTNTTQGTIIATLLQPAPEVFDLFDQYFFLMAGEMAFLGSKEDAVNYFPNVLQAPCPPTIDFADFVNDFLTNPLEVYKVMVAKKIMKNILLEGRSIATNVDLDAYTTDVKAMQDQLMPPILVKLFQNYQCNLKTMQIDHNTGESSTDPEPVQIKGNSHLRKLSFAEFHEFSTKQYGMIHARSFLEQVTLCIARQAKIYYRNRNNLIKPRFWQSLLMGVMIGTYFQINARQAIEPVLGDTIRLFGFFLTLPTEMSFFGMMELPISAEGVYITNKQIDRKFFSASAYMIAVTIIQIPLICMDLLCYGTVCYFSSGLARTLEAFFTYLTILFTFNGAMNSTFRAFSILSPTLTIAQLIAPVFVSIMMVFGGFLITLNNIPNFLIWLYYLSPFSWVHHALSLNECYTEIYTTSFIGEEPAGIYLLKLFGIIPDRAYIWAAILYLLLWQGVAVFISTIAIRKLRYISIKKQPIVTTKTLPIETTYAEFVAYFGSLISMDKITDNGCIDNRQQLTMTWENVCCFVTSEHNNPTSSSTFYLNKVSGSVTSGRLLALMGASGSGKTTLLDVLSRRRTIGQITGQVLINGVNLPNDNFREMIGYVEQEDSHMPLQTIREALYFSAQLRLSSKTSPHTLNMLVQDAITSLEMESIADIYIRTPDQGGISHARRKLLSIGCELVCSPAILFLDEPTSGLDSQSALKVISLIRLIAAKGPAIVCTIHQPSQEVFCLFDELILLKPGGKPVYAGPIGLHSIDVISFFEKIPGVCAVPLGVNPASWILDLQLPPNKRRLSSFNNEIDWPEFSYTTAAISFPALGVIMRRESYNIMNQFFVIFGRYFRFYYRDFFYNGVRIIFTVVLGVLYGLFFYNLHTDTVSGLQSGTNALITTSGVLSVLNLQSGAPLHMSLRPAFYREQNARMYFAFLHAISQALAEIPYILLCSTLFVSIFFPIAGFSDSPGVFFHSVLVYFLLGMVGATLGQSLTAVAPNNILVQVSAGFLQAFFWMFNGVSNPKASVPRGWLWMVELTPYSHAANALAAIQFGDSATPINYANITISKADLLDEIYNFSYDNRWFQTWILLAYIFAFIILSTVGYSFIRHGNR